MEDITADNFWSNLPKDEDSKDLLIELIENMTPKERAELTTDQREWLLSRDMHIAQLNQESYEFNTKGGD